MAKTRSDQDDKYSKFLSPLIINSSGAITNKHLFGFNIVSSSDVINLTLNNIDRNLWPIGGYCRFLNAGTTAHKITPSGVTLNGGSSAVTIGTTAYASDLTLCRISETEFVALSTTGGGGDFVESVVAGTNVTVDDTDPANPVVSAAGGSFSGATVNLSADLTNFLSNATWTAITFTAEIFDTDDYHDNSTNNTRLTVPAGVNYVSLHGQVQFSNNSTSFRHVAILKNGVDFICGNTNTAFGSTSNVRETTSVPVNVSENDYFELYAYQQSGSDMSVSQKANWFVPDNDNIRGTQFSITKLG
jgi:hypothetical protein